MNKIVAFVVCISLTVTVAWASTLENFEAEVKHKGIEAAVDNAVKANISVPEIVEEGLGIQEINPQNLVKALYCAGIKGDDVRTVAAEYNISEMIVEAGYEKSVAECLDKLADDAQPYTENVAQGPSFMGKGRGGIPHASPD